jgi:ankyrin repeat protein
MKIRFIKALLFSLISIILSLSTARSVAASAECAQAHIVQEKSSKVENPNSTNSNENPPLSGAIRMVFFRKADIKQIEQLLKQGADVNSKSAFGYPPLGEAAFYGQKEIVQLLLKHPGIEMNARNAVQETPLILASQTGSTDTVKLLLQQPNIELNAKDLKGRTALIAALFNHPNFESAQHYGEPPVINVYAVETAKVLLAQAGIDVLAVDCDGNTALNLAQRRGYLDIIKLIEQKMTEGAPQAQGAIENPSHTDHQATINSQLIGATADNNLNGIRDALKMGADINAIDENGNTPLMIAISRYNQIVVDFLLKQPGVRLSSENYAGSTVSDFLRASERNQKTLNFPEINTGLGPKGIRKKFINMWPDRRP